VAKAIFTSAGTWIVRLRVSDDRGQTAVATRRLDIAAPTTSTTKKRARSACTRLHGAKLRACRVQQARRTALAKCRKLKRAARTRCERRARAIGRPRRPAAPSR
jgi:hypothetical protein